MHRGRGVLRRFACLTAVLATVGSLTAVALAAQGDPDPNFNGGHPLIVSAGPPGSSTALTGVAKEADGKFVVAGSTDTGSGLGSGVWVIRRYLPSGHLDGSFGTGGTVKLNLGSFAHITGVLVQPADQKIVVAGSVSTSGVEFARLNPNGTLDHSFGGTGEVALSRSGLSVIGTGGLARDAAGNLYLVGSGDTSPSFAGVGVIAAVTSTGTAKSWAPGGILIALAPPANSNPTLAGVAVSGTTVFFAGSVISSTGPERGVLGAVSASSGSRVPTFGSGGLFTLPASTALNGLILGSDGKLKATGFAVGTGPGTGALLASFRTSGSNPTDTSFGSHGRVVVGGKGNQPNNGNAIAQVGGELVAATTAIVTGNSTQMALVGVNLRTGALDKGLGPGGFRIYPAGAKSFSTAIADPGGGKRHQVLILTEEDEQENAKEFVTAMFDLILGPEAPPPPPPPPEADFRLVITHTSHFVPAHEWVGVTASGKALYEALLLKAKVTNDGHAAGAANLLFLVGPPSHLNDPLSSELLFPDSQPDFRLRNGVGDPIRPGSKDCENPLRLAAGQTIEITCFLVSKGRFSPGSDQLSAEVLPLDRPTDPSQDNDTNTDNRPPPREFTVLPDPQATVQQTPKTGETHPEISGTSTLEVLARDVSAGRSANPAAIKKVLVALVRVPHGAHAARAPSSCRWLASTRGRFVKRSTRRGTCAHPVFLKATGTAHWHLRLTHKLACGSYVVYAAAVDNAGFTETTFSSKQGNRRTFKIC